ncbi:hypothetical protein PR202_gb22189 [Eleusine coracana subsp. coracana]|uniref:Uncharacterized protein n=1 Tax=Eleusine coracana subsp. coracana TaxID=191504 RepID=A0AAV5FH22_ELECO|nr:hypothetical protein PR202_gb22189 [Eleusine coracana subsp. coracana]
MNLEEAWTQLLHISHSHHVFHPKTVAPYPRAADMRAQAGADEDGEHRRERLSSQSGDRCREQASKASARAAELEKQIEKLKKDIKDQNNKKASLEARASDAEKKVQELNAKLEKLQRTSDEQKRRIQKTELALKAAEEELLKVQMETTTKLKQLREVGVILIALFLAGSWSMVATLEVMSDHWNEHGKPVFNSLLQKASEISVEAKKWAKPHVETAKTKWVPVAKEKWVILKKNSEPYVRMASTKSVEVYQASKDFITPHLVNAREAADPYLQIVKHDHALPFTDEFDG